MKNKTNHDILTLKKGKEIKTGKEKERLYMMENKADEKKIETREDVNDANGTSDANEANKANRPYEADGTVTAAVSPARLSMGPAE